MTSLSTRSEDRPTILVAEDEEAVRSLARLILEQAGFEVWDVADGTQAVELFRERGAAIQGALLDLTMPSMGGEEALAEIHGLRPDLPVVLTSGYDAATFSPPLSLGPWVSFLKKPYVPETLVETMLQTLQGTAPAES